MGDFAEAMRALMAERGISGNALARKVPCDSALISRYRCGKQKPSAKMARAIDHALGAEGSLVALAGLGRRTVLVGIAAAVAGPPLFGALDLDGRERLAWAQAHPQRIDAAAVQSLADVLAAQRRAEDALGSVAMLKPVVAQLAAVEELAAGARGPLRLAVIDVAQQWCQFAAWLHTNARDFPAARTLWRLTLELAVEADDATMTATVLRLRGYMAWLAAEPGPMIGLAQAAQRDGRAAVSQRACAASFEARGHAMTGDAAAAERKLGEADELAGQLPGRAAEPWSYWYSPGWLACQRGITLGYLAHMEHYRVQAIEALASAHADVTGAELSAGYLVYRAAIHARGGDVGEACADGLEAAPVARQTNSAGLRGMLTELHAGLAMRWPDNARVAELADALR